MKEMNTPSNLPPVSLVCDLFDYDPITGILTWKAGKRAGKPVGSKNTSGYLQVQFTLDERTYRRLVHIVIWAIQTGEWPLHQVDHENHRRDDNRWQNLRAATHGENMRNLGGRSGGSSKIVGVYFDKASGKWRAQIRADGKLQHLGVFDIEEEAIRARKTAEIVFGYHPNHGTDTAAGERPIFGDRIEVWAE
jgi:hypothetical protein